MNQFVVCSVSAHLIFCTLSWVSHPTNPLISPASTLLAQVLFLPSTAAVLPSKVGQLAVWGLLSGSQQLPYWIKVGAGTHERELSKQRANQIKMPMMKTFGASFLFVKVQLCKLPIKQARNQLLVFSILSPLPSSDLERTLHPLGIWRTCALCVSQTKCFWQMAELFVCYQGPLLCKTALEMDSGYQYEGISAQLANAWSWLWTVAVSTVFLRGVYLPNICTAATWSKSLTFAKHYGLDIWAKLDISFGRAM